ncbi:2Fe-2S iron-sulfur cluster binding domain-containing protein [Elizabethkingia argentiflava]|uniref:2Fe-2S iron-sulfur cluster binding domain-containing protein n=1 Tax=Elizabethkingia argenteiflava TaxID=2681556 RepID=A0A845PV74_9FLAO|nr:iron-sulfur cluster-binding domain-containing protein [Elizabethkingia argenteiflava]NAW51013.1 2Fe-2S iron-sulfur cluster binding domain-containing protein [Elizabethkingia argenteiflava]
MTKNSFSLSFEVPDSLKKAFLYNSGQYSSIKWGGKQRDYSYTSAPYEECLSFGIKFKGCDSFAYQLYQQLEEGEGVEVSEPRGRFTIALKPNEKRSILGFAAGIGISPIISHLKNILYHEPYTRFFLFYSNRDKESIPFIEELSRLQGLYSDRLQIFFFFSREQAENPLFQGRLDEAKLSLIINQILHLDEEDEESTIWDATDEVLICGPGGMIKSIANACYKRGIRKKNIHFELFEEFNEDIYEIEETLPIIKDINVKFTLQGRNYQYDIPSNETPILSALLEAGFNIPYSCKSGICGSCRCRLTKGKVYMVENDYLTEKEVEWGLVLPCVGIALTKDINLNFDNS